MLSLFKASCIVSVMFAVVSCQRTTVKDATEYVRYIDNPENGLIKEYSFADKGFKLMGCYKTPEYSAIKEIGPDAFNTDNFREMAKDFEGGYHFNFVISSIQSGYDAIKGKLSPNEYIDRITYMSGAIRNDFKLVAGLDTIPCSVCHFERTYNISPDNIIMLVFPYTSVVDTDLKLIYEDKIFGVGSIVMDFKNKDIKNTPKLL